MKKTLPRKKLLPATPPATRLPRRRLWALGGVILALVLGLVAYGTLVSLRQGNSSRSGTALLSRPDGRTAQESRPDGSGEPSHMTISRAEVIPGSEPPGLTPEGMVWIPGGEFWMGDERFPDATPVHRVYVDGF